MEYHVEFSGGSVWNFQEDLCGILKRISMLMELTKNISNKDSQELFAHIQTALNTLLQGKTTYSK